MCLRVSPSHLLTEPLPLAQEPEVQRYMQGVVSSHTPKTEPWAPALYSWTSVPQLAGIPAHHLTGPHVVFLEVSSGETGHTILITFPTSASMA